MWVQINDRLLLEEHACVSIFDRGFMYGDGVFETMRTYAGKVFLIDQHLNRLRASADAIGISLPRSNRTIASDIATLLTRNGLGDAVVRIRVSRGVGAVGTESLLVPTYVVSVEPLPEDLPVRVRKGIRLANVDVRKTPDVSLPASAKHANYLNSILALAQATAKGADDAVLLALDGTIAETSRANLFLVKDGTLCTPALAVGVLPGITRRVVLELAAEAGISSSESAIPVHSIEVADEVFVTNSVMGIVPVFQWQDRRYAAPGPKTAELTRRYEERVGQHVNLT